MTVCDCCKNKGVDLKKYKLDLNPADTKITGIYCTIEFCERCYRNFEEELKTLLKKYQED